MSEASQAMEKENQLKRAVNYFKSEPVYAKLFQQFKMKYESLGRMSGTIPLKGFSRDEVYTIAQFLGLRRDILVEKQKVSLKDFEKQLTVYQFEGITLKEVVETYFDCILISKKEVREQKILDKMNFFIEMRKRYPNLSEWLSYIERRSTETRWIHQIMDSDRAKFADLLKRLSQAMKKLPQTPVRLPVFAQQLVGNPHALDRNERLGRLFIHRLALESSFRKELSDVDMPQTSEEISELLLEYNLLRDDITNDITMVNILAKTVTPEKESFWNVACQTHTVMNVPIRELLGVERFYSNDEFNKVYIVENSGIFSSLLDEVPDIPLICTHGQFKLAIWKCLDLFDDSTVFYYAGDMDPEGIGIANKLIHRYGEQVQLWKMNVSDYEKSVSKDESLTSQRINKLKEIQHPTLKELKKKLLEIQSPAYQEALLDEMIEEVREKI
jgi:uncharacterized protein (TIGR02679 family)